MSKYFYEKLEGFSEFTQLVQGSNYQRVPPDWYLVLTDVKGSTKAIEAGRYKEVNTIGAATLAALNNAIKDLKIPFVFGGDGATALIPNDFKEAVIKELCGLKNVAKKQFSLDLRVGIIPISELEEYAGPVLVGKYLLEGGYPLAVFMGGALAKADELIKQQGDRYEIDRPEFTETDLRHLSCRWQPLQSKHGRIISLLIYDPKQQEELYTRLIKELDQLIEHGLTSANPVKTNSMVYRGLWDMLEVDKRHQMSLSKRLHRQFESVIAYFLFRINLHRFFKHFVNYMNEMETHSDYRKFDDMLRMVIDCSSQQIQEIHELLEKYHKEHGICYGVYESDTALMTCYTPGFSNGVHVHFIDGADGGYALAAKQLKAQLKELETDRHDDKLI